jgi:hypothetical protein
MSWATERLGVLAQTGELVREGRARYFAHEMHDEIPGAGERVEEVGAIRAERFTEFLFQNLRHTLDYEAHDGRRRLDDAARVGQLHAEVLEKLSIDGVDRYAFAFSPRIGG